VCDVIELYTVCWWWWCDVASATVTVMIEDINDHLPVFTQSVYKAVMSESFDVGTSIISISATDADVGANARLLYTLREHDREFFTVVSVKATNTGVLKVHRVSCPLQHSNTGVLKVHRVSCPLLQHRRTYSRSTG